MNENLKWIAAAVAVVGVSIGAILYFSPREKTPPPDEPPVVAAPAPPPVAEEPAVKHPVPVSDSAETLPPLDGSDLPLQQALSEVFGREPVEQFVIPEQLVRHIVVSIDNLPEQKLAERLRPLRAAPGTFAVTGSEEIPVLDPANYQRYQPLVRLFGSIETPRLIALYSRYYPLFQEAYENLGHPPEQFNDRLVQVIDHLLQAPELEDRVPLEQPGVLYQYADPKIEALSAGQKLLIRMGGENARAVKTKLREVRAELVAQRPAG
jgi:hypothetical protein